MTRAELADFAQSLAPENTNYLLWRKLALDERRRHRPVPATRLDRPVRH